MESPSFFFDKLFSKNQCGFRKGFNTQHILLVMLEKMKTSTDNKQFGVAILTDPSKAFDCICYLLIAKLSTYGFIYDYLNVNSQIFLMAFQKDPYLAPWYLI